MNRKKALAIVKEQLTESRYVHTKGVTDTAVLLAEKYGADVKKAELKTKEVEQTANRRLFIIIALGALLGVSVFLRVKNIF